MSKTRVPATVSAQLASFVDPEAIIDAFLDRSGDSEDPCEEVYEFVDQILKKYMTALEIDALRKSVNDIDDSGLIELAAIKAGFLMGFHFANSGVR